MDNEVVLGPEERKSSQDKHRKIRGRGFRNRQLFGKSIRKILDGSDVGQEEKKRKTTGSNPAVSTKSISE